MNNTEIEEIQESLGFCGCGQPETVLLFLKEVLELISDEPAEGVTFDEWYPGHRAKELALFHSDGIAYFVWYVLADKDITEHGGSVPGWLTEKGEALLSRLREIPASPRGTDREG